MARHRKFHHSRRGHAARKWIGLAGKIIGGAIMAAPAISAVTEGLSGGITPEQIPGKILYNYTGVDPAVPGNGIYVPALASGIASVAGGFVVMKIFSFIAKKF